MARIQLSDNLQDVAVKMSEGNPGALMVICELLKSGKDIDPQGFAGGLGAILSLDTLEIYGTDIYILFNDQCNRDVRRMLMLIRSHQLGFITKNEIKQIAGDQMRQFCLSEEQMDELDDMVCERLSEFKPREIMVNDLNEE